MNGSAPVDPAADESSELSAAVAALASFQSLTQQTDGKANMLLAVHVGIGAVVVAQLDVLTAGIAGPRMAAGAVYLVAFVAGGEAIVQTMRPRTGLYPSSNPFGVPRMARVSSAQAEGSGAAPKLAGPRSEQAWEAARAVALIASHKNRHVVRAIAWVMVTSLVASAWFALAAFGH